MSHGHATSHVWLPLLLSLGFSACTDLDTPTKELDLRVKPDVRSDVIPTSTPFESGVEGYMWIGPTCPVIHAATPCPDRLYEAEFSVTNTKGEVVAEGKSDANGFFRIPLPPGSYVLVPVESKPGVSPSSSPVPFDVKAGSFTQLEITFDSGLR